MDLGIAEKRALVTAAGRGLGREIALQLAAEGATVTIAGRTESDLAAVVAEMGEGGHGYVVVDFGSDAAVEGLAKRVTSADAGVDIVVHNLGGTLGVRDPLSDAEQFASVMRHNLGVAQQLNAVLIPAMSAIGWGRAVHVSSSAAVLLDASLPYSVAKAALNAYVKGLGRAVASSGVVASAVMPGPFVAQGGHWDTMTREHPERVQDLIDRRLPVGRLASVDEIASVAVFLCSQQASYCAGAVFPADGGME